MTDFNILRKRYSEVLCGRGHSRQKTAVVYYDQMNVQNKGLHSLIRA